MRYQSKKTQKRTNKPLLFGIVLFILSVFGYSYAAISKDLPVIAPNLVKIQPIEGQDVSLPWPTGQGALGTFDEGLIISSPNQEVQRPIASMTKLVTALALLEKQPLEQGQIGKTYAITAADVALYHSYLAKFGSVLPVRVGQQLSQYHALQALLISSANNIADTLVINEFGSLESYTQYANEMLAGYGLTSTTVNDASGFSPSTTSTPSDMLVIGTKALQNPVISEIVATRQTVIPGSGTIRNTNLLLADEGVIGLKTGTTDEAGSCLIFAFDHQPEGQEKTTIIGVVMGVPSWPQLYNQTRELIASTKTKFQSRQVAAKGQVVGTYETPWGEKTDVVTAEPLDVYDWIGNEIGVEITPQEASSPLGSGAVVGSLSTDQNSTELVLQQSVGEPSVWWRLKNFW